MNKFIDFLEKTREEVSDNYKYLIDAIEQAYYDTHHTSQEGDKATKTPQEYKLSFPRVKTIVEAFKYKQDDIEDFKKLMALEWQTNNNQREIQKFTQSCDNIQKDITQTWVKMKEICLFWDLFYNKKGGQKIKENTAITKDACFGDCFTGENCKEENCTLQNTQQNPKNTFLKPTQKEADEVIEKHFERYIKENAKKFGIVFRLHKQYRFLTFDHEDTTGYTDEQYGFENLKKATKGDLLHLIYWIQGLKGE